MSKCQLNLLVSNLVEIHNNLVMEPENLRTNTKRLAEVILTLNDQLLAEGLSQGLFILFSRNNHGIL